MSRFYTGAGDDGFTGLLGEGRISKDDPVTEALGAIDEATASLGLARALCQAEETGGLILRVQRHLYSLMAEVAATPENAGRFHAIDAQDVAWLEEQANAIGQKAPSLKEFIIPGDTPQGAALDLARAVIRRAERRVVALSRSGWIKNPDLLQYLNRLSSLIFVLELYETQTAGKSKPTLAKEQD